MFELNILWLGQAPSTLYVGDFYYKTAHHPSPFQDEVFSRYDCTTQFYLQAIGRHKLLGQSMKTFDVP